MKIYIRRDLGISTFFVHHTFIEFCDMEIAQAPPRELSKIDKLEKKKQKPRKREQTSQSMMRCNIQCDFK